MSSVLPRISIIPSNRSFAASYNRAVGSVAEERVWLATTTAFPVDRTILFMEHLEALNAPQFFAVHDGMDVIGWCDIIPKEFEGMHHVGTLGMGVVREWRGKGIGKDLLHATLHSARERGLQKIELEVYASNTPAIALYDHAGFEVEGRRKMARKLDGVVDDILLMGLVLPS